MKQWTGGIVALCLLATGAMAGNAHVQVRDAWTRAVPAVAPVAGGFLTVVNDGDVDDRLLRVESDIAQRVELHQMRNDGGVMRMRALPDGVVVPAHGKLELKPGGYHLMLMDLKRTLKAGEKISLELRFETRERKLVTLPLEIEVAARAPSGAAGGAAHLAFL